MYPNYCVFCISFIICNPDDTTVFTGKFITYFNLFSFETNYLNQFQEVLVNDGRYLSLNSLLKLSQTCSWVHKLAIPTLERNTTFKYVSLSL